MGSPSGTEPGAPRGSPGPGRGQERVTAARSHGWPGGGGTSPPAAAGDGGSSGGRRGPAGPGPTHPRAAAGRFHGPRVNRPGCTAPLRSPCSCQSPDRDPGAGAGPIVILILVPLPLSAGRTPPALPSRPVVPRARRSAPSLLCGACAVTPFTQRRASSTFANQTSESRPCCRPTQWEQSGAGPDPRSPQEKPLIGCRTAAARGDVTDTCVTPSRDGELRVTSCAWRALGTGPRGREASGAAAPGP